MTTSFKTALITGASGGIGEELARVFAESGRDLVIAARSGAKLEALAEELERAHGVRVTPIPIDLIEPTAPEKLFDHVTSRGIEVDILVNNAALMVFGAFKDASRERLRDMTRLNVGATMALTHLFLAPMIERDQGHIMNIASIGAFLPMPSMAVYAATKSFLLSFSEALSEELEGSGVSVTAFCAGFTRTPMLGKIEGVDDLMEQLPASAVMDPKRVAREAFEACMTKAVVRIPGKVNNLVMTLFGIPPRWAVRKVGGVIGRRVM